MLEEVNKLFKMICEPLLPEGMKLYHAPYKSQVLFEVRGDNGLIDPNIHYAYLVKNIGEFRFNYGMKFADLTKLSQSPAPIVKRAVPFIENGIKEAIKKFTDDLADPVKVAEAAKRQKERNDLPIFN